ncbi:Tetratricopeptide TPR_2 repeat protein [Thermosinus carboxydivorans Nor1]|uniref:Tetratricopeptide TPR_2 repeat protein n=1 Tax=Thermosinus carboxydivorans Nor1 TaxID=401526 RepID=A1HM89_9FIRM|nr:tetratricopeptide repeat protein [Thermosinus carboxydivorans]EAX48936.1 Tetratricopeptide TPR_2 repeat protein [Thermosinus carboxydivorans Nor1]
MKIKKLLFALTSLIIAAEHKAGEAAPAEPGTVQPPLSKAEAIVVEKTASPDNVVKAVKVKKAETTEQTRRQLDYLNRLFQDGQYERTVEEVAKLWPEPATRPAQAAKLLAESYARLGKNAQAQAEYQAIVGKQPDDLEAQVGLAYTLVYGGQVWEGLQLYDKVLSLKQEKYADIALEDAVALLAQGNVIGGRALFEKIINYYPSRSDYQTRYVQALAMFKWEKPATANWQKLRAEGGQTQLRKVHEQAVALARQGNYDEAITLLDWLKKQEPNDLSIAFDYITILAWAGHNEAAIKNYEALWTQDIPDYVRIYISDAYRRTGNLEQAMAAIQPVADQGDRKAKVRLAELWLEKGDKAKSYELYDELLKENKQDIQAYLSRADSSMRRQEYSQAAADYKMALRLIPDDEANSALRRRIAGELAAAFINLDQPAQAIVALKPYIANRTATKNMEGNYILALRNSRQARLAVYTAGLLWPKLADAPIFGLQALADCYIELKDYEQAIAIYRHLAVRSPDDGNYQFLAAFYLLLSGKIWEGLAVYDELLAIYPDKATVAINQASSLIATGHLVPGRALFELIVKKYPGKAVYRQQYAEALAGSGLHLAAYQQYYALAQTPDGEAAGLTGMLKTALAVNDYQKARQAYEALAGRYGKSKAVAAIMTQYDQRRLGQLDVRYIYNTSYKQLSSRQWQIYGEQNGGDNYWLMADSRRYWLNDWGANERQILDSNNIGIGYIGGKNEYTLWYGQTNAQTTFATWSARIAHTVHDRLKLSLAAYRSPVLDVQALSPLNGGPVMVDGYSLSATYQANAKDTYTLTLNRELYTDENQAFGFSLAQTKNLFSRGNMSLARFLTWSRSWYSKQDLVYESPSLREAAALGWDLIINRPNGYWYGRLALNWDRDYPDPLALNPYLRLERAFNFGPDRLLLLGTEYGARTGDALGRGSSRFGYRQFDLLYRMIW